MSARGAPIRVVSLTLGEAGQIRDADIATRRTLGRIREAELSKAAAELGVTDVVTYDRGDGTLAGQPLEELLAIAAHHISDFEPDVIISFGPDGAYGHPDHVRVSDVATLAGTDSGVPVYHAAFPRQSQRLVDLLVDWLSELDERFRGTPEFAHGLMMFADGSSMLGFASDHMDISFFPAGTFIVEQGEAAEQLFLVLSGEVDVIREDEDGLLEHVATTTAGSFFGEVGLARGTRRNAHVVAKSSVTCFVLSSAQPSLAAGRGSSSEVDSVIAGGHASVEPADIELDLARHAMAKMRALACHRSQYAVTAEMFPPKIVEALFGIERFNKA